MNVRAPNMTEKLAATLLAWLDALGAPIPRDHAQAMSASQICSLFEFDHWPVRRVDGGTNHPDNLLPRFIPAHGVKTATIDVPQIAKRKRIVRFSNASVDRLLAKQTGEQIEAPRRKRAIQSRPFSKGHQPMRGRNDLRRRT